MHSTDPDDKLSLFNVFSCSVLSSTVVKPQKLQRKTMRSTMYMRATKIEFETETIITTHRKQGQVQFIFFAYYNILPARINNFKSGRLPHVNVDPTVNKLLRLQVTICFLN